MAAQSRVPHQQCVPGRLNRHGAASLNKATVDDAWAVSAKALLVKMLHVPYLILFAFLWVHDNFIIIGNVNGDEVEGEGEGVRGADCFISLTHNLTGIKEVSGGQEEHLSG